MRAVSFRGRFVRCCVVFVGVVVGFWVLVVSWGGLGGGLVGGGGGGGGGGGWGGVWLVVENCTVDASIF